MDEDKVPEPIEWQVMKAAAAAAQRSALAQESMLEISRKMEEKSKTLRDEFAMAALGGILAAAWQDLTSENKTFKAISEETYRWADAMMEARSSSTPSETPTTNSSQ